MQVPRCSSVIVKDVAEQRFGRLVAVRRVTCPDGVSRWECRCDCGNVVLARLANLGRATNSCGCLRKEVASKRQLKPIEHVIVTQIWNYYQRNATIRSIPWSLTKEHFGSFLFKPCHYCGDPSGTITKTTFLARGGKRELPNNGVDRVDTSKGYTEDNCVTACRTCNVAKNNLTVAQFIAWARRLVNHQNAQLGGA